MDARFQRLAAANAEGAFDFEHEPEQYLEQEARNGFEFGLERLLDGIEGVPQSRLTRVSSNTGWWWTPWTNASTGAPFGTSKYERTAESGLPVVLEHRAGLERRHLADRILGVGLVPVDLPGDADRPGRSGVADPPDRSVRRHEVEVPAAVHRRDRRAALLAGLAADRREHDGARDEVPGDEVIREGVADPPAARHLETLGRPGGRAPLAHARRSRRIPQAGWSTPSPRPVIGAGVDLLPQYRPRRSFDDRPDPLRVQLRSRSAPSRPLRSCSVSVSWV